MKIAKLEQKIMKALVLLAALATIFILGAIVFDVLSKGLKSISWEFLTDEARVKRGIYEGGIYTTIISTLYLTGLSILIAAPIGIGAGIYMTEYVKENMLTRIIRFGTEALAGIPSIVFGLFGYIFFVLLLDWGWSMLSGSLTLALMILPTIVRTAEEAIKTVPIDYRHGSLALGGSKWQTIWKVVLPSAIPGIVTGIILGVGRAVGETAAVLLTAGSNLGIPENLMESGRNMAVHLYIVATESPSMDVAYGTGAVLIIVVFFINMLSNMAMRRIVHKR